MPQASRLTRTLLWISTACATVTIVVLVAIFTQVRGFAQANIESRESDTISACRAEFRGDIDLATARINDLILRGLVSVATEDPSELNRLATTAPDALDDLNRAVDTYVDIGPLSRTDPARFIARCQER